MAEKKVTPNLPFAKPEVELNTAPGNFRRANERESSLWLHSPANMQVLKHGMQSLKRVADKLKLQIRQVDFIRVGRIKGLKRVYLFPTADTDQLGIQLERRGQGRYRQIWANLTDYLGPWGMALEQNTRSRFRLVETTEEDSLHPAVYFELDAPIETKLTGKKGKSHAAQGHGNGASDSQTN